MDDEVSGMPPITMNYKLQTNDMAAYSVGCSLYQKHLKDLSFVPSSWASRIARITLKALVMALVFFVAVYVFKSLLEAGRPLDLFSIRSLPLYGVIIGMGVLISAQLYVQRRSEVTKMFSLYASENFSVRLEATGFSVRTNRMDARFLWDAKACRVVGWKDYLVILHQNTMVVIPQSALPCPASDVLAAIEVWQTGQA